MLPIIYQQNMQKLLGEKGFCDYLECFNRKAKKGVVLNTLKLPSDEILKLVGINPSHLSYTKSGYVFADGQGEGLGATIAHHAGLIYLQEPSSMAPATLLGENLKGLKILDLCASPGGKTFDIALSMQGEGLLVSNEIVVSRARVLFSNVERLGLKNVVVTNNSPAELAGCFDGFFDCVLVDAPCSGEGMFRKDLNTQTEWNELSATVCQERQKEILFYAQKMLKPGGRLVYSTCTFNTLENEEVVKHLVNQYAFIICEAPTQTISATQNGIALGGDNDLTRARRFYPMSNVGEGQFMCLLKKPQNSVNNLEKVENNYKFTTKSVKKCQVLSKKEKQIVEEFIAQNTMGLTFKSFFKMGNLVFGNDFEGLENLPLNFICLGTALGEIVKDRFEPHHHFFKMFGDKFLLQFELNESQTYEYLFGREVEVNCDKKGFACVKFCGVSLGGAKLTQKRLKNYYPKGLRGAVKF